MSGASRVRSSTAGSIFFAVAKVSALSRTADRALSVISKVGSELCDIDCGMADPYLLLDYLLQMNAAGWRDEWWPRNRYGSAAALPQGSLVRQRHTKKDTRKMAAGYQQLPAGPITR